MRSVIREAFDRVSTDQPNRIAVYGLSEHVTRTFEGLSSDARAMAQALDAVGLPTGPCVVSDIGNRVAFFSLLLAALDARAALVLLDGDNPLANVQAVAHSVGANAIVFLDGMGAPLPFSRPLPGGLRIAPIEQTADASWRHNPEQGPMVLKTTSGSGGKPRCVLTTEDNLVSDAHHIIEAMSIGPEDVSLAAIPLAHSYGLGNLVMPLLTQGSPVALRHRFAPRVLHEDITTCGVTTVPGVPYFFDHLRRAGDAATLGGVRLLITAGAPIPVETVSYFKQAIGRKIHSFYGSTETGGISYDDCDDVGAHMTVGRPMPGTEVELRPWDGVQQGEGRVFVRGKAVAAGYATPTDPEAATSMFVDGGFLTGDIGTFDGSGRVVLRRRVSRFINVAGRKVDPAEVEAVVREMPGVVETTVIGMPCDTRGEQVVVCIRRDGLLSDADVRAYCAARLAVFKVPRQVVFADALPVGARGKLDRQAIQTLIGAEDTSNES